MAPPRCKRCYHCTSKRHTSSPLPTSPSLPNTPMADSSITRHSPKYKDFLFDRTVTLYVGPDHKRMEIHKKLLMSISPELNKHVSGDTKEGIEGVIHLPGEGEEALTLFIEWAYTGDYVHEDVALGSPLEPEDPWPSLHKHLQLCAFSDKFNVPILKQLAESKFHAEINRIEPNSEGDATGLVMVIGYAYDNLPSSHPIPKFLAQFASWKLGLLRATAGFKQLTLARPAFLEEFLMHLNGLTTRPTTYDIPRPGNSLDRCSQRGSPSVLDQDEDGRHFIVPSGLFQNLPCNSPPSTRTPLSPGRDFSY